MATWCTHVNQYRECELCSKTNREVAMQDREARGVVVDVETNATATFACVKCDTGIVNVTIAATGRPSVLRAQGVKCSVCDTTYTVEIKRGEDDA